MSAKESLAIGVGVAVVSAAFVLTSVYQKHRAEAREAERMKEAEAHRDPRTPARVASDKERRRLLDAFDAGALHPPVSAEPCSARVDAPLAVLDSVPIAADPFAGTGLAGDVDFARGVRRAHHRRLEIRHRAGEGRRRRPSHQA